jgi:hypothetical protein
MSAFVHFVSSQGFNAMKKCDRACHFQVVRGLSFGCVYHIKQSTHNKKRKRTRFWTWKKDWQSSKERLRLYTRRVVARKLSNRVQFVRTSSNYSDTQIVVQELRRFDCIIVPVEIIIKHRKPRKGGWITCYLYPAISRVAYLHSSRRSRSPRRF